MLATSALAILTAPLAAQDAAGLREEIPDYAIIDKPLIRKAQKNDRPVEAKPETDPVPAYVPTSQGATADTTSPTAATGEDLFSQLDSGDAADSAPLPVPSRKPSTARARDDAAKAKAEAATGNTAKPVDPVLDAAEQALRETDPKTGTVREPQANASERLPLDEGSEREAAIEGLTPKPDDNPYDAPGIRAGSFILRPSLEQGVTWTSNARLSVDGDSAVLSETTLRLNAASDWNRHSATLDAYGTFRKSLSGEELDEKEAGVDAALNLDLADDLRASATLGYARRPDSASSAVVIPDTVSQPLLQTFTASAGLSKDLGKLRFGITGRLDRNDYGDADLATGGTLSQQDRNSTLASVILRGGYQISPAITPFAEIEVGKRRYDEKVDAAGYERSSDRLGARAGVALDLNEKLVGEVSAGWIREGFDDDRLSDISGATASADLRWSPERGTTVSLAAATSVEGTTTPGESGSILNAGTLTLERAIRANLIGNAAIGGGYRDFSASNGHDTLFNAQLGATWWLNRYAGLTGRVRYESLKSNLSGRDYDATSVFLGVKLQR